jgi:uncharacterized membrane protein
MILVHVIVERRQLYSHKKHNKTVISLDCVLGNLGMLCMYYQIIQNHILQIHKFQLKITSFTQPLSKCLLLLITIHKHKF